MTATRTHILRAAVAGAVISAGLLMTSCSSAPVVDPAAVKACTLLADAENTMRTAVYQYLQDGSPVGGSDAARAANARRGPLATEAFNAAPASLTTVFSAAERAANLAVLDPNASARIAIDTALTACVHAGVPVQVVEQSTGQTHQLTG